MFIDDFLANNFGPFFPKYCKMSKKYKKQKKKLEFYRKVKKLSRGGQSSSHDSNSWGSSYAAMAAADGSVAPAEARCRRGVGKCDWLTAD